MDSPSMKKLLAATLKDKDYFGYLILWDSRSRLEGFARIQVYLNDEDYWKCLSFIYTDSKSIYPNRDYWIKLLSSRRPQREFFLRPEDWDALKALPDTITIHRGFENNRAKAGISWTTDLEQAKFFAHYRTRGVKGKTAYIASGVCAKKDVIGFFNNRQENEIVILPSKVKKVVVTEQHFTQPPT